MSTSETDIPPTEEKGICTPLGQPSISEITPKIPDEFCKGNQPQHEVYSIFSKGQKRWIASLASFGAMFSTLSSYVYFPALVPMASDFSVSVTLINLTVTSYLVVAGVAPAFMGDIADQHGRRPAYLLMYTLLVVANVGIALVKNYPGLFVLRMIQSAGASGSYGAAYGVIADVTTLAERGGYAGIIIFFTNAAPSFGPVVSGALTNSYGWRSIFWLLLALTGTYLLTTTLFLPETQRKIVGNGSIRPTGLHRSLFDYFTRKHHRKHGAVASQHCHIPNPWTCIPMLFQNKGNLTVILVGSIYYTVKMVLQASLAVQFIEVYNLDYLQAGLVYLPSAIGGAIGSFATGKFLDIRYKKFAIKFGQDGDYRETNSISDFPIEEARFALEYPLVAISVASTIGFGVSLMTESHIAVPLIMQFVSGAATSSLFTMCCTVLTDLNPDRPATVQASYNLVRCIGAGAGIASQQPLLDAVGSGWCFGMYAVLLLLGAPLVWLLKSRGLSWRKAETGQRSTAATSFG